MQPTTNNSDSSAVNGKRQTSNERLRRFRERSRGLGGLKLDDAIVHLHNTIKQGAASGDPQCVATVGDTPYSTLGNIIKQMEKRAKKVRRDRFVGIR